MRMKRWLPTPVTSYFARATKLLAAAAIFLALSTSAFAQGEVDFENFSNSLIYTNSVHNGPATGLMTGTPGVVNPFQAGSYLFVLLAAETNTTTIDATLGGGRGLDNGGWDVAALYGVNTATPGLMNGNIQAVGVGPVCDVFGWGSGETVNFAVVGWSANIGDNWGAASAWWNNGNPTSGPSGWFGISDVAQDVVVGGGGYPIPTIFGPTPGYEVQGFTLNLYTIPEPSAFALAGFGIVTLLAFNRPKAIKRRARSTTYT
jgi:hypothetical protein